MPERPLLILTWNVRDLRVPERRRQKLDYLLSISPTPDIFLLQEHKLTPPAQDEFASSWHGLSFFSQHCLTLVPPSSILSSVCHSHLSSSDGRALSTHFRGAEWSALITNLYAPVHPIDRGVFFSTFDVPTPPIPRLASATGPTVKVIGGDLNDCPDPAVDRKHQSVSSLTTHWASLASRLPGKFIDAVRSIHPVKSAFTRPHRDRNKRVVSWSRIDYILVRASTKFKVITAHTLFEAPGSDHRPVMAGVSVPQPPSQVRSSLPETGAFTHRLHYATFDLPEVEDLVASAVDAVLGEPERAALVWEATKSTLVGSLRAISKRRAHAQKAEVAALTRSVEFLESLPSLSDSQASKWATETTKLQQITSDQVIAAGYRAHIPEIASEQSSAAFARRKIATRRKRIYIPGIQDTQDPSDVTSDLDTALDRTRAFFQAHYTPSAVDPEVRRSAREALLAHLAPGEKVRMWCARRLQPADAAKFDLPFTSDEVLKALSKTDLGRSPGPSGIPYEFYRTDPQRWASVLAAVFNNIWDRHELPFSMSEATVRLLFKSNKPGAEVTNLAHYRPITLRETDYKILAKVIVARLNQVLGKVLPPSQHGFVPGRSPATAGTHVALLLEELASRGLPDAALLSLDQRAAYDLVDHEWIFMVYRAYGFPERFLTLLTTIYDGNRLTARYNINGFYTDPVSL
ncbi:MAG: reverse transcriptase domain-containing protein, partial [Pseudomonas amygdali]